MFSEIGELMFCDQGYKRNILPPQKTFPAGVANAQESFGQDSAGQICSQLPIDKASDGGTFFTGNREKTFETLSDDLVKQRVLRIVALVFDGVVPERDRGKTGTLERETGFAGEQSSPARRSFAALAAAGRTRTRDPQLGKLTALSRGSVLKSPT
jgi:hypothetical protein